MGSTNLVGPRKLLAGSSNRLFLKLEGDNPAGSVKDRPARSMIMGAEERGEIEPGQVLIEATSGNTGIALAMIAAVRGYRMRLIMPENLSVERRQVMRAYGPRWCWSPRSRAWNMRAIWPMRWGATARAGC